MWSKIRSRILKIVSILLFCLFTTSYSEIPAIKRPSYLKPVQLWASKHGFNAPTEDDLHMAFRAGIKNNLDPFLILAVIGVESSFQSNAKSNAGAIGYMQVVPKWHLNKISDVNKLYDPQYNVSIGSRILAEYLDITGSMELALKKYSGFKDMRYSKKVLMIHKRLLDEIHEQPS